jgi:hypothetical protein
MYLNVFLVYSKIFECTYNIYYGVFQCILMYLKVFEHTYMYLNVFIIYLDVFECTYSIFMVCFNVFLVCLVHLKTFKYT